MFSPSEVAWFVRAVPGGGATYLDNKVVPEDTKEVGGTSWKQKTHCPGMQCSYHNVFFPLFRPFVFFWEGGAHFMHGHLGGGRGGR